MTHGQHFGVLDNRFLSRSVGLLDPQSPLTLKASDTVGKALELLRKNKIGCIVVTDQNGQLNGIFTERDVLLKLNLSKVDANQPIAEVMTPSPQSVQMTTPIAYVLQMMSQGGFRHVPVVDDEQHPVGMVSVKDIVDYIVSSLTKDLQAFSAID